MSEYEYEQPTHDEPTADYPPADQYDNLIGQPIDGGFDAPHHEQTVGGFTANDGYGPDVVNYGDEAPAEGGEAQYDPNYTGGDQPDYAGNEAGTEHEAGETGQYDPNYAGGEQPADEPNYAADGGEYAQPTQGTSTSGTSVQ
jgi:hypothetical protein